MTIVVSYAPIKLLNASDETLNTNVPLQGAIRLLYLGRAEIIEAADGAFIHSSNGVPVWPWPTIIRLIRYVWISREKIYGPPQVTKRGVLDRDSHVCAYCGSKRANTVDHVIPRSKGGRTAWKNLVAACRECNNKKRDRTPAEAGMKLRVTPYAPKRKASGWLAEPSTTMTV